jgi:mRNA interferase RelE/StbE
MNFYAMTWQVELSGEVQRQIGRTDAGTRTRFKRFMAERLATGEDPRRLGHALQDTLSGLWRSRIGDYRLICRIEDTRCVVLALSIGHRRDLYRDL